MNTLKQFQRFVKNNTPTILLWLIFIVFLEAFSIYYISQERYVYAWDYATYFTPYYSINNLAKTGIINFSREIFLSLSYDYNLLAVVPLLLFRVLFGPSRVSYVAATLTVYALPSLFLFTIMVKKATAQITQNSYIIHLASIITLLINPFFFAGLYLGFVDVFGVGIISFIYARYFLNKNSKSVADHILLGLLLTMLMLFRRGYGFWITSFVFIYFGFQVLDFLSVRDFRFSRIIQTLGKTVLTGFVFVSLLFLLAPPIARKAFFENYSNIYDVFRDHPFTGFIEGLFFNSGPVPTVLLFIGIYIGFLIKRLRRFSLFIVIQAVVTLFMLTRVQNVMDHQYYFFYPAILYFVALPIVFLLNNQLYKPMKYSIIVLLLLYSAVNFLIVFIPGADTRVGWLRFAFPSQTHHPLKRNDLKEIGRLIEVLSTLNNEKPGNIYMFSISNDYNNDIFRNYCGANTNLAQFCSRILWSNDIDKRDGFPIQLLTATYVVVPDTKFFLIGKEQHVVGDLISEFFSGGPLSRSYIKMPFRFVFDNDVTAYIFLKNSTISPLVIDALSKRFQSYYPNNPRFIFSADSVNQEN